jgi:hypothetical protein
MDVNKCKLEPPPVLWRYCTVVLRFSRDPRIDLISRGRFGLSCYFLTTTYNDVDTGVVDLLTSRYTDIHVDIFSVFSAIYLQERGTFS